MKSASIAIGIMVGVIVAVVLCIYANRNHRAKSEYDERQKEIRGRGYQYAFYAICIYEFIMMVLGIGDIRFPFEPYLFHFAGILIGVIVLSGYCIWHDAFWGLNNNRKRYAIIFLATGILNAIPVIGALTHGGLTTAPLLNLLVLVMLLILGSELLIKHLMEKRDAE